MYVCTIKKFTNRVYSSVSDCTLHALLTLDKGKKFCTFYYYMCDSRTDNFLIKIHNYRNINQTFVYL